MYANPNSRSSVLVLLIAICFAVSNTRANNDETKPNIIFILADDMGWMDAHCYGHLYAKTLNIDKLAVEGTRFLAWRSSMARVKQI